MSYTTNRWESLAAKLFCIAVAVAVAWLTFKYVLEIVLPFLIAFIVAAIIYPLSTKAERKTNISHKLWAFIYVILALVAFLLIITLLINRIVTEAGELLTGLETQGEGIISSAKDILDWFTGITSRIPFLENLLQFNGAEDMLRQLLKNALISIAGALTSLLGAFILKTPSMLLVVIVSVVACFYLSMDYKRITESLISALPKNISMRIETIKIRICKTLKGYLRAYFILFLITFSELFIGLWILKQKYAFLTALIVAFIDLLPIFGTGIVLVPWGIFMILDQNYFVGFGLLIIYATVTIVRQIAEPHFIGESLGLHPILSLFAMFAGWNLFGIAGMLFAPPIAIFIKDVFLKNKDIEVSH